MEIRILREFKERLIQLNYLRSKFINPRKNEILEIFRRSLALRGAYGIVGIARCFRVMDNNLDKTISIVEFQQACKDFKIQLTADDIIFIFNQFD